MPGIKLTLAQAYAKQNYAAPNHILIDDRKSNIDQWISQGGIGILHTSAADTIQQLKKIRIMSSLNSLSKGYKGGDIKQSSSQLTPSPQPNPTITSEQMIEAQELVSKMDLNKKKKQPIDVKENRQINTINNGYKQKIICQVIMF